jgi:hypothetical protein
MNENNKNDATYKSEINATMAFTPSLSAIVERQRIAANITLYTNGFFFNIANEIKLILRGG